MLSTVKDGPLGAFALGFVGLVGIIVLAALGHPIPVELWALETAVVGGALGITNPNPPPSSSSSSSSSDPIDQAGGAAA